LIEKILKILDLKKALAWKLIIIIIIFNFVNKI